MRAKKKRSQYECVAAASAAAAAAAFHHAFWRVFGVSRLPLVEWLGERFRIRDGVGCLCLLSNHIMTFARKAVGGQMGKWAQTQWK